MSQNSVLVAMDCLMSVMTLPALEDLLCILLISMISRVCREDLRQSDALASQTFKSKVQRFVPLKKGHLG